MDASHILLGRPWEFDRHAMHDCVTNKYQIVVQQRTITLKPLTPQEVYNEQVKMSHVRELYFNERKECERKESERLQTLEAEHESQILQAENEKLRAEIAKLRAEIELQNLRDEIESLKAEKERYEKEKAEREQEEESVMVPSEELWHVPLEPIEVYEGVIHVPTKEDAAIDILNTCCNINDSVLSVSHSSVQTIDECLPQNAFDVVPTIEEVALIHIDFVFGDRFHRVQEEFFWLSGVKLMVAPFQQGCQSWRVFCSLYITMAKIRGRIFSRKGGMIWIWKAKLAQVLLTLLFMGQAVVNVFTKALLKVVQLTSPLKWTKYLRALSNIHGCKWMGQ